MQRIEIFQVKKYPSKNLQIALCLTMEKGKKGSFHLTSSTLNQYVFIKHVWKENKVPLHAWETMPKDL